MNRHLLEKRKSMIIQKKEVFWHIFMFSLRGMKWKCLFSQEKSLSFLCIFVKKSFSIFRAKICIIFQIIIHFFTTKNTEPRFVYLMYNNSEISRYLIMLGTDNVNGILHNFEKKKRKNVCIIYSEHKNKILVQLHEKRKLPYHLPPTIRS